MSNYSSKLVLLGTGSYGDVHSIKLNKTDENIAVKRNFIRDNISFLGSIKEMDFLVRLRFHPNVIKLKSIYISNPFIGTNIPIPKISEGFKMDSVYFSMELGIKDGYNIMIDPKIDLKERKKIILDLVLGLEYIHSQNIIHRDIKPSNFIQVKNKIRTEYKWCDYGMSSNYTTQDIKETDCITIASFRAPEIAFNNKNYNTKSDMWSMGCLMIELITNGNKHLLNLKNENISKRLPLIILKRINPIPTKEDVENITKNKIRGKYDQKRPTIRRIINLNKTKINDFNSTDGNFKQFLDLTSKLLVLDSSKRYSATQALKHPFFSSNSDFIKKIHSSYDLNVIIPKINIINCENRNIAYNFFVNFLETNIEYYWHRERVMFHALRIFDRFLVYNGDINLNKFDISMYTKVCYYIALKLFVPDIYIPDFFELFEDIKPKNKPKIYDMEVYIINDILNGKIYEMSLFEVPDIENDILTIKEKEKLYKYYSCISGDELDILILYKKYKKEYNND